MTQRTLAIIKPDAVKNKHTGEIISMIEKHDFRIVAARLVLLTRREAEGFYAVHRERPFFPALVEFMTSGPCLPMVLEKENAIEAWRAAMGATDPAKAGDGTIRKKFGANIERNATHGSDAPATAADEIAYFFPTIETGRL